ncbi:MAG: sodium:proton antiporter [Candidatus Aenigmatarchaeota archaeon]|nr:MAG: sodium:proton antiporter [Candidatus Aenigmarchaeota archaeon]
MSIIVKTMVCLIAVPVTVFGLYVVSHGHLTPGGGFPGGTVIATLVALMLVAFGKGAGGKLGGRGFLSSLESIGLFLFAFVAFLGMGSTFFGNFLANTGGIFGDPVAFGSNPGNVNTGGVIPFMNLAVGLEVFAALSLIILIMFTHSKEDTP